MAIVSSVPTHTSSQDCKRITFWCVQYLRSSIGDALWEIHVNHSTYPGGMEDYIVQSCIDLTVWGSEIEVYAMSHLLNVPICEYFDAFKNANVHSYEL